MSDYQPSTFGDRIAGVYDELYSDLEDVRPMVATLAGLAGAGRALELGIGTGRVGLPLAARGVEVHGIDASEAMLDRLRSKKGGTEIPVTLGDFADVGVEGTYSLIFLVFNTFFALNSQVDQVRCFGNVAEHLTPDGVFVIEAFVPDPARFVRDQHIEVASVDADSVMLQVSRHDSLEQRVYSQEIHLSEGGTLLVPVQLRYAWPSELDLMAQLAGLRLRERWGGWRQEPFTDTSADHVSVYERL